MVWDRFSQYFQRSLHLVTFTQCVLFFLHPHPCPKLLCIKILENKQGCVCLFLGRDAGVRLLLQPGLRGGERKLGEGRGGQGGQGELGHHCSHAGESLRAPQEEQEVPGAGERCHYSRCKCTVHGLEAMQHQCSETQAAGSGFCLISGQKTLPLQSGPSSLFRRFPVPLLALCQ